MKKGCNKVVATLLSLCMIVGMIPATSLAAVDYEATSDEYYKVISKDDYEIAPGITESEIVLNNDDGSHRQVAHVMEVDINNPYTKVIPSSKGMTPTAGSYGVQVMSEQAQYAEENGYGNVVGAMNISLSWYNSDYYKQHPELVGEPLGYIVLDGEMYTNSQGQSSGAQTCLVINFDEKDGEARPSDIPKTQIRSTSDAITGWEEQVIPANFGFLVKDGVNQYTENHEKTNGASRSFMGIKEDGTIITVMNDGRQEPYSVGFTNYEMAEFMISLGCVWAVNGDGGGSSAFLSQRPGEELELHCSPSDGAERPTTHGILIISTAPSTGEFVRADVRAENDYYTPNSTVAFTAVGADLAGGAAEIPAEAEWKIKEENMGTIEDGVFTSNGTTGTATAQLVYNGEVVGEDTIHIVIPEKLSFSQSNITVPYGKTVELKVNATYGVKEVVLKDGDFSFSLSDASVGTLNGNQFTACDESVGAAGGTITVKFVGGEISDTATLIIGKASEVVYDFEDGVPSGFSFSLLGGANNTGRMYAVDETSGQVYNGKGALAIEADATQMQAASASDAGTWYGVQFLTRTLPVADVATTVQRVGMWVYLPEQEELVSFMPRFFLKGVQTNKVASYDFIEAGDSLYMEDGGWHYFSLDTSTMGANKTLMFAVQMYHKIGNNTNKNYYLVDHSSMDSKYTLYIDDITLDFSTAVEDRENPVFEYVNVFYDGIDEAVAMNGQTIDKNQLSFLAKAVDDTSKSNYTGIDTSSAKVYVDGVLMEKNVSCTSTGIIHLSQITLADGTHTVKFEICDNMGNKSSIERQITVAADSGMPTVKVVPADPDADKLPIGSLYWMNVEATDIEKVQTVTMELNLNSVSQWELDHMEVAYGFDATYTIDEITNNATITITATGKNQATGNAVLASLPIRTWENKSSKTDQQVWDEKLCKPVDIKLEIYKGVIEFVDATTGSFSMKPLAVDTELYGRSDELYDAGEYDKKDCWHQHTAVALDDKAATCTENGYAGRTFCEECNSVVEWGTTEKAFGHDYQVSEGVLSCTHCQDKYNGELDGKTYINGVIADGWVDDTYYYVDGVVTIGSKFIDGKMYTFDDAGLYLPDYKYDGFYEINDTVMYFVGNEYLTGNQRLGGEYYNFYDNGLAYDGEIVINGTTCIFDNGVSVPDETVKLAGICGPDAQFVLYQNGKIVITGSGPMTDYNTVGNIPWYEYNYRAYITTVEIGEDITTVGQRAFHNSPKINTVIFKGTKVTKINAYAFGICTSLKTLILPEGVKSIAGAAFHNAPNLEYVYVPASVTSIGGNAFKYSAEKVTLGVIEGSYAQSHAVSYGYKTEIIVTLVASGTCGDSATWELYSDGELVISGTGAMTDYTYHKFGETAAPWAGYREDIKKVTIGKGIESLSDFAFYNCTNLTAVEFEAGSALKNIGSGAFGYTGIKTIAIPATVKSIENNAFYFSGSLETVAFEEDSKLSSIGNYAFRNCTSLKSVYIPDSVTSIGTAILYACGEQATMNVAEGTYGETYANGKGYATVVREAKPSVLYDGTCGDSATWELYDNGVLVISGTGAMTDYTYHKTGATAAPWAGYRASIQKVVIGKGIESIADFAFYNCTNLTAVEFEAGSVLKNIGIGSFGYTGIKTITIPATVKTIENNAFYFSARLEFVAFEENSKLSSIGNYAFRNCTSLKSVYIPDSVISIGAAILYACGEQATMNVAEGTYGETYANGKGYATVVREPAPSVLYDGTCGETATWELYDNGVLVISGTGTMTDYTYHKYGETAAPWAGYRASIQKVVIGKGIESIADFAFYNCTNLTVVEFEAGSVLKNIGAGAFGYTGIVAVTIPATVEEIENNAFYFSASLETVTVEENSKLATIGNYAFRNCTSLKSISIPSSVTKIGAAILYACGDQVTVYAASDSYAYKYAVSKNYNVEAK